MGKCLQVGMDRDGFCMLEAVIVGSKYYRLDVTRNTGLDWSDIWGPTF